MELVGEHTAAQPVQVTERKTFLYLQWGILLLATLNLAWTIRRLLPVYWDPSLAPVVTTNCEEEALFAIWKYTHGQPAYSDPAALPFAVSYFNWLFYFFYGGIAKICFSLFYFQSESLPLITRSVTLGMTFGCVAATYRIAAEAKFWPSHWSKLTCVSFVSLLFFNDLFSEWIITTRPDIGGLMFELIGLWCALRYLRRGEWMALMGAVISCYVAWSFKHNMVAAISGLCIVLFHMRRWRELVLVVAVTVSLYVATFALGGALYRFSILGSQKYCSLSFGQFLNVMKAGFDLLPALAIVAAALVGTLFLRRKLSWDSGPLLLAVTSGFSWFLMLVTAAKRGADYNYFFEASVLGFLWILKLYQTPSTETRGANFFRFALPMALFACGCVAARTVAVTLNDWQNKLKAEQNLTDRQKRTLTNPEPEWVQLRKALAALPAPVLVTERRYNLPWVQMRAPHFVTGYTYALDRNGGQKYAEGGIGGLIAKGYFKTIVTPLPLSTNFDLTVAQVAPGPVIDGQALHHYQLHHSDRSFAYYIQADERTEHTASFPMPEPDRVP